MPFMSLSCHGRAEDKDLFDQILAAGIFAVTRRAHCENSKQGPEASHERERDVCLDQANRIHQALGRDAIKTPEEATSPTELGRIAATGFCHLSRESARFLEGSKGKQTRLLHLQPSAPFLHSHSPIRNWFRLLSTQVSSVSEGIVFPNLMPSDLMNRKSAHLAGNSGKGKDMR